MFVLLAWFIPKISSDVICYDYFMTKRIVVDRTQPNSYITGLTKYKNAGALLDMGAGHGRHAIYFAQQGFEVIALEPDAKYCEEIIEKANDANLQITVIKKSFDDYTPNNGFDVIVCAMVLHFLNYSELLNAVKKMQSLTKNGGLNVISAYTDKNTGNFMQGNPYGSEKYLLKQNELKELYKGWKLLEYSEAWTELGIVNPEDTPTRYHKVNMIAQKP